MLQQQLKLAACMKIRRALVHSLVAVAAGLNAVLVLFVLDAATTAVVLWSLVAPAAIERQLHLKATCRFGRLVTVPAAVRQQMLVLGSGQLSCFLNT
jgi:hypothetical protein